MQTHKWVSNSPKVLESVPTQRRASEISLDSQEASQVKTSGILWCTREDVFTIKASVVSDGIIRSDGRLAYAEFLFYDVRYPVMDITP